MTAMLDRIWPGLDDKLLLFRFILHHFDKCYTSYFVFLMWRDIKLAESPGAYVRICDWQRANTREGGVSRQLDNTGEDFALHLVKGIHYPPDVIHAKFHLEFGGYTGETSAGMGNTCNIASQQLPAHSSANAKKNNNLSRTRRTQDILDGESQKRS